MIHIIIKVDGVNAECNCSVQSVPRIGEVVNMNGDNLKVYEVIHKIGLNQGGKTDYRFRSSIVVKTEGIK